MTRVLTRNAAVRRVISLTVVVAFVLSLTNVGLALAGDESQAQESAQQQAAQVEAPAAEASAADAPEVTQPQAEPSNAPGQPEADQSAETEGQTAESDAADVDQPKADKSTAAAAQRDDSGRDELPDDPNVVESIPVLGDDGVRVTHAGDFTYMVDGVEVQLSVTFSSTEMGQEFSFTSSAPVTRVVAKGGSAARVTEYAGAMSDSGLHAPMLPSHKWAHVAHIDFYFDVEPVEVGSADITVYEFNDANGNGVEDAGEEPLNGWTVCLVRDDTVVESGVTHDGVVVFEDVAAGSYLIDESLMDGWRNTTELPIAVTVDSGDSLTYCIGNQALGEVTKTFSLAYGNAPAGAMFHAVYQLEGGEEVHVPLESVGGATYRASVDLPAGSVIEYVRWAVEMDGAVFVLGEENLHETLDGDMTNTFDYSAEICGYKFGDTDFDGTWDEGEEGLGGWTIELYRAGQDEPVATAVTDPDGSYAFYGLLPGTYYVEEQMQDGWYQTCGPQGTFEVGNGTSMGCLNFGNALESVAPTMFTKTFELTYPAAPIGADFTAVYTLAGGQPVSVPLVSVGAGMFSGSVQLPEGSVIAEVSWMAATDDGSDFVLGAQTGLNETMTADVTNRLAYSASISGHKFGDSDADATWDGDETGLSGWTIDLFVNGSTTPIATLVTDADGAYSFQGLLPGSYVVEERMQDGWSQTAAPEGAIAIANGDDVAAADFGNTTVAAPFTAFTFTKAADRTEANPGDIVTYALTYELTADSGAWTDPIPVVDDYDERYMTPVDVSGGVVSDGKIMWTDDAGMQPGESRSIVYTMRVSDDIPVGATNIGNVALLNVQQGYAAEWSVLVEVPEGGFLPFTDTGEPEPALPFTGGELSLLMLAGAMATTAGGLFRWLGKTRG